MLRCNAYTLIKGNSVKILSHINKLWKDWVKIHTVWGKVSLLKCLFYSYMGTSFHNPHTVITLNPIRSEFPFSFSTFCVPFFYFLCGLLKIVFHVKLTLFCLNSRGFDAWARGGHLAVRHLPPSGHARRSQERYYHWPNSFKDTKH
jgi:hypothetical protein